MKIQSYIQESPLFALNTAYEQLVVQVNLELKQEQVNLLQGLILTAIFFETEQSVNPALLAQTFQTSRSNISHCVSHLEYLGFLKRTVNGQDARGFFLTLTPLGRKKALMLIKYFDGIQNLFESKVSTSRLAKTIAGIGELVLIYKTKAK